MIYPLPSEASPLPSWRYRESHIAVCASAHLRWAFTEPMLRHCLASPPEAILIELPTGSEALLPVIRQHLGLPGLLARTYGESGGIPISAADSICVAAALPHILRNVHPNWSPEIVCIDPPHSVEKRHSSTSPGGEDWVVTQSAAAWLGFLNKRRAAFARCSTPGDSARDFGMAQHIAWLASRCSSILLVIGAAHWPGIHGHLEAGVTPADPLQHPLRDEQVQNVADFKHLPLQAASAWAAGFLDDMPFLVWRIAQSLADFSSSTTLPGKGSLLSALLRHAVDLNAVNTRGRSPSLRQLAVMQRYLTALLALHGRTGPWVSDLRHAGESCVHLSWAKQLVEAALDYPGAENGALIVRQGADRLVLSSGPDGGPILVDSRPDHPEAPDAECVAAARLVIPPSNPVLPTDDLPAHRPTSWHYVPAASEQEQHRRMYAQCRDAAHRQLALTPEHRFQVAPCTGTLGLGVDLRRTLAARIAGNPSALAVRVPRCLAFQPRLECDGRCPIVWIFDSQATPVRTQSGSMDCDGAGWVYASHYWFNSSHRPVEGITESEIAYFVSLGLREIAPYTKEAVSAVVNKLEPARRCQVPPWRDADLREFHGVSLALACAIKYARDHLCLAAQPDFTVEPNVVHYAQSRRIKLLHVTPSAFPPEMFERLKIDTVVPSPSLYSAPYEWTAHFVKPVPR